MCFPATFVDNFFPFGNFALDGDLFPQKVVAHGHDAHANQEVHERDDQLCLKEQRGPKNGNERPWKT
jgi:hypothetical protein